MGDTDETEDEQRARAVKFVKGSESRIEGLAIPFGGPFAGKDLDGEDFGPDTDFAFEMFPAGRPLMYDHGLNVAMQKSLQGRQTEHEITDEGIFARAELDKSAKYHSTVAKLIAAGKLFFSSGTINHLIDADNAGHIKSWPWVELSLTPTPANPFATVHAVKSSDLIERLSAAELPVSGEFIAAALRRLDSISTDDDSLPDGLKFAEHADRLLADVEAFRTRLRSIVELRAKSGRRLSAETRERLLRNTPLLHEVAYDIEALMSEADAGKSSDFLDLSLDYERTLARLVGVELPAEGASA